MSDEPQSAMMLTQQEWSDLAAICQSYRVQRETWLGAQSPGAGLARQLKLCERIEEAA